MGNAVEITFVLISAAVFISLLWLTIKGLIELVAYLIKYIKYNLHSTSESSSPVPQINRKTIHFGAVGLIAILMLIGIISSIYQGAMRTMPSAEGPDMLNIIDGYVHGQIAYVVPDTMDFNKPSLVEAAVHPSSNDSALLEDIEHRYNAKIKKILVGPTMSMKLTDLYTDDSPKFKIKALTQEKQAVDSVSATLWRWSVIPTESGINELNLTASIVVEVNGQRQERDIPIFTEAVYVTVPPPLPWDKRLATWTDKNWEKLKWVLTALLFPFVGWLSKIVWEKWKESNKKPEEKSKVGFQQKKNA